MFNPKLYQSNSNNQQKDSREIFEEFLKKNELKTFETILDIGCGPADNLVNDILPLLRRKPSRVVGIDYSKGMVELACQNFSEDFLEFRQFDIQLDDVSKIGNSLERESFDLVTSFFVYHWIRDERKTLSNVYNMMKVGGSFFMIFPAQSPFYDVIIKMSKCVKYKDFIDDLDRFISPYYYESDPASRLKSKLTSAGFKSLQVELRDNNFQFSSFENLAGTFEAINPFKLPDELYKDFITECTQEIIETYGDGTLNMQYKLLVSFVTK